MPFIIALERSVQSVGINEKYDSGESNKHAESVPPGNGRLHRFSWLLMGRDCKFGKEKRVVIQVVGLICKPNRVKITGRIF